MPKISSRLPSDKHYESQESYKQFLEGRGLEDLLLQMKDVIKVLQ